MQEGNQKILLKNQESIREWNQEIEQEKIEKKIPEAKEIDTFSKILEVFEKNPEEFEDAISNFVTILGSHLSDVTSVCFSADGSMIASGSSDKTVKVWNVKERKEEFTLERKLGFIHSVCFNPDSSMIAIGSSDSTVKVLNIKEKKHEFTLEGHSEVVTSVCFSGDGLMIASGSQDKTVKVWNVTKRKEEFTLDGHLDGVRSICFSPDDSMIASGSNDKTIKVWKVKKRKELFTFADHSGYVSSVCFSRDGSWIASGSEDNTVKVWNITERKEEFTLNGHLGGVRSVCFSEDDSMIASGSNDKTVKVWNFTERKEAFTLADHSENVSSVCFSSDGSMIVSGSHDKTVKIWNIMERNNEFILEGHLGEVNSVCFSIDGSMIASGSNDRTVKVWNVKERKHEFTLKGQSDGVCSVCFNPDGSMIASGLGDNTVKIWNVKERKEEFTLEGHLGEVNSVCFNTVGSMIASGSSDKTVKLWNFKERKEEFTLEGHLDSVTSVCFSVDGSMIASGSLDQTVKLWKVKGIKEEFTLEGHLYCINSVCFSVDGSMIAIGSTDFTVKVWNVKERKKEFTLKGHSMRVISVCFSADGSMIASGSQDNTVKVWNVKERKEEFTLKGHSENVSSVCFSSDCSMIVSGSHDQTVKVWNIKERKEEFHPQAHFDALNSKCISSDGVTIASGQGNKGVKVFPTEFKNESMALPNSLLTFKEFTFPRDYAASNQKKLLAIRKMDLITVWSTSPPEKKYEINGYPRKLWKMEFSQVSFLMLQNRISNELKIFDRIGKEILINKSNPLQIAIESINLSANSIFFAGLYDSVYYFSALNALVKKNFDHFTDKSYNVAYSNNKYSPLHILSYLGETNLIKKLFKENNRIRIKIDYFNHSPVFYSILGKHQAITDFLLDYISQAFTRGGRNEVMSNFLAIEFDLPQIIKNSSPSLCALLDASFSVREKAPQFGTITNVIRYSSLSNFSFTELANLTSADNTDPLNLKVSAFTLPETIASESSIYLLNCILNCKIKDIYKLPVIRAFLNERWDRIRPLILAHTFFLWINIVFLIVLVFRYDEHRIFTACFALINGFLTIWEMLQLKSNGWAYFTAYWNVVGILRIALSYVWLILLFYEIENETLEWIAVVLNLIRGITGFRAFETTRYYIKLILDSLISIKSFLLVFIYTTVAFGLLKIVTSKTDSDISSLWKDSFGMAAGNSDKMDSDQIDLKYLTFVAAIFLNIILMLNMIISILGDSFDEFQLFATYYNGKEMAEVILEIETILSLFKKENTLNHLHTCFNAYEVDELEWKGKVIDMRVYIDNSTAKIKRDADKEFKNIQAMLENNKKSLEDKVESNKKSLESNIKSLEDKVSSMERKLDYLITSIGK